MIVLNEQNPHLCCQEQFHLRNSLNMLIESVVVMLWKLLYHGCQVGFKNVVILPQKAEYFVFVQMLLDALANTNSSGETLKQGTKG